MNFIRLLPVILSYGLLAAHFSRAGYFPLVLLSLIIPMLLFVKKKWAARILQVLLLIGGAEWIRTMLGYIEVRKAVGEDWGRLAIILISVALLTACSGLVFTGKSLKRRYKINKQTVL
jgi:hypothetical protein